MNLFDTDLEIKILATMQHDPQSRAIYASMLKAEHFYKSVHQKDFHNLKEGKDANFDFIDSLSGRHEFYATVLSEMYIMRQIYKGCHGVLKKIKSGAGLDDIVPVVETLQRDNLLESDGRGLTISQIDQMQHELKSFEKLDTGYNFLDFYETCGSHKGQTEVIFGHPKHGKSVYAIYRACGYLTAGYKGLYITMEDTHIKIRDRIASQLGSDHQYKDNMILADRSLGARDLEDIITFLRYHKIVDNIDFAVIDYIQRVPVKGLSPKDEVARVTEVSNRLTDQANELDLFVIMLAQPHRIEKHRTGWMALPDVSDLYGSGAIEKDAFVATAVFRPNQLDSLCHFDGQGQIINVKGWSDEYLNKNSVFIKQRLKREGEKSSRMLQLIHTDNGLNNPSTSLNVRVNSRNENVDIF